LPCFVIGLPSVELRLGVAIRFSLDFIDFSWSSLAR
jgi:hypothetical protein